MSDIMARAYRMKFLGSMAILLLVACRSAQGDAADDERALTKLVQDLNVALAKADMGFLERALHKDFVLTNSKGTIEDRAAYLANRKTGRIQYESRKSDELRVRVYGDCAIVTGRDIEKGKDQKGAVEGQFRWTRVFLRQDGRWQLVTAQFSPVVGP